MSITALIVEGEWTRSSLRWRMTYGRFQGFSDEELADIWYALAGAEIRHPECFKALVDATIQELELRRAETLRQFLHERFSKLRTVDALEDAAANRRAEPCDPPTED